MRASRWRHEIKSLGKVIIKPKRPVVLVLGGAKASDKLGVIAYFKNKADWFLLGGGGANTILWLKGMDVRKSIKDSDPKEIPVLKKIAGYKSVILPTRFCVGQRQWWREERHSGCWPEDGPRVR